MCEKIIAACGNDCAVCPRYNVPPYTKTAEELHHTAELWYKIGYRDHVVTNEEIACTGCKEENWCRYRLVKCVNEKHIVRIASETGIQEFHFSARESIKSDMKYKNESVSMGGTVHIDEYERNITTAQRVINTIQAIKS